MLFWFVKYFSVFFLFFNIFIDFEFILCLHNLFLLHFIFGLRSILVDYIHLNEIKFFLIFLVRLFNLFLFNFLIELFF